MNLFLTGGIQVGKTTLIKRLIQELGVTVGGFCTARHFAGDRQDGFIIQDITEAGQPGAPFHYIARGSRETGWQPVPETFETVGVQILAQCLETKKDLIIMDELGHLESGAPLFQEMVHRCLSFPVPVLGVLKERSTPFLDSIRQRPDVRLVPVTAANREEQYGVVRRLLLAHLKR
ncbi:MAG TPA: hypothetical protein GX504_00300 [Clostridia bacterium]|nr:hypothetical protein [Clostridia bacterium]